MTSRKIPLEIRFRKQLGERTERGCLLWAGAKDRDGYGVIGDGNKRQLRAPRVAFILGGGVLPDGYLVLHQCDVRACVEFSHLFAGTNDENMADMVAKRRHTLGERNCKAKLTEDSVRDIRTRWANGQASQRGLAREYGLMPVAIYRVIHRWTWKHVD